MAKERILVIEDDRDIIEVLAYNLEREGYSVLTATNGEAGIELARERQPSVILLDVMLPGLDGIGVTKKLRSDPNTREIAIIMLSAKGEETDVVLGLGVGADDYVTKPFRIKEVLARIQAVLRRGPVQEDGPSGKRVSVGPLVIDTAKYQVWVDDREIALTLTEFKLLSTLATNPGRVFTRSLLLDRIQGEAYIDERNIDVHVRSIRKKLGKYRNYVVTVRGVGYRFRED